LAGNAGGTAYAPVTLTGSGATATLSSAGVLTLSAIANATLSNSAITIGGNSVALGGTDGWTYLRVTGSDFSVSVTSGTGADITGLVSPTLSNNTIYEWEAKLYAINAADTTGM